MNPAPHNLITQHKVTTDTFFRFFAVVALVAVLWFLRDIFIAILVSVVIASAISPLATRLRKYYIPRALTVFVILACMVAVFVAIFVLLVPTIYSEFATFSKSFYVFQRDTINYIASYTGNKQFVSDVIRDWSLEDIQNFVLAIVTSSSGAVTSTASAVSYFVFQTIFIFVISFYLAVLPNGVERFLRVVTPSRRENYVINLWARSQTKIVAWAKGQFILAVLIGTSIYIGLTIIGMDNAFLFALLAAVGEVIPIVGMMMATIPAVLVALLSTGPSFAVTVLIFYVLVTQFENHILAPLIVNKVVGIPSVVVIIALVIGATLGGFWGVLLAVPVAATIMEFVGDIESSKKAQIESISQ
jgi:predicted PurR-regulated permease PerM